MYSPTNLIFTTPIAEEYYYPCFKVGKRRKAQRGPRSHSWSVAELDSHQLPSILALQNSPCALESELLLESGVKVLEEEERPSDLMGNEELLALLRLREEETEALL